MVKKRTQALIETNVPEILRDKCFELAAYKYTPQMIVLMIEEQHNVVLDPEDVRRLIVLNDNKLRNWRNKIKNERVITPEALTRKLHQLIDARLSRALADWELLQQYDNLRTENDITEDDYQRKTSVLYLPTPPELVRLMDSLSKKLIKPAGVDELPENDTPPEPADTTRQDEIEAAIKTGDPLKIHAAMYPGATSPDASRTQEQAPK